MVDSQGFKNRLESFIKSENLNNSRFEKMCGLANGTIRGIRNGMRPESIQSIGNAFPQLNLTWLLTGEGDMYKTVVCEEVKKENRYGNISDVLKELDIVKQKLDVYEGRIENYEKERTRMLDNISQLTSIITKLTEGREKLSDKNN